MVNVDEMDYGRCAFPQNFHTRNLSEISLFYVVRYHCISVLRPVSSLKVLHKLRDKSFIKTPFYTKRMSFTTLLFSLTVSAI